ncbi:MAG: hypothetical protein U1E36_02070 [Rickettsiales bacterium]
MSGFEKGISECVADRRNERFMCSYQARLANLTPQQLGGMDAQTAYSVSMGRIYEQRAGIGSEGSLALRYAQTNAQQQGTPTAGNQWQPGIFYYDEATGKLGMYDAATHTVQTPEGQPVTIDPAVLKQVEAEFSQGKIVLARIKMVTMSSIRSPADPTQQEFIAGAPDQVVQMLAARKQLSPVR